MPAVTWMQVTPRWKPEEKKDTWSLPCLAIQAEAAEVGGKTRHGCVCGLLWMGFPKGTPSLCS